jgi:hypothetical protein
MLKLEVFLSVRKLYDGDDGCPESCVALFIYESLQYHGRSTSIVTIVTIVTLLSHCLCNCATYPMPSKKNQLV